MAAVRVPAVHELVPLAVYPESQSGWQVAPEASVAVQVPTAPLVGAADASHEFAEHVAAVRTPVEEHELVPLTVYPESQSGWQVLSKASVAVQVPTAPLVGATDASHGAMRHCVSSAGQ